MTTQLRQLTDEEIATLAARFSNNIEVLSLCNEVMGRRQAHRGGVLEITTLLSMRSKKGMVQFAFGPTVIQLEIAEARAHAMRIIEAAAVAETEEVLVRFMREHVGLNADGLNAALIDLRRMRNEETA